MAVRKRSMTVNFEIMTRNVLDDCAWDNISKAAAGI